jgi:hypothetical protein
MTQKQKVEAFIVLSAWTVYLLLVITKVANIEGFVVLSTYIVKKYLDLLESEKGGDNVKNTA